MLALLITKTLADVVGLGQHCGGFISNSNTCAAPYTCVLSKIPDAGGLCQLATATDLPGVSNLPSVPTGIPTGIPTGVPTGIPTNIPTGIPTGIPTLPTNVPQVTQSGSAQQTTTAATPSSNSAASFGVYLWTVAALLL
ncbi:hypothetical protein HDV01_004835 [Terramyces sp. JEL0728]|nr:hypothetical protein HDV01_004835 [Terramyces sp. JEL0728]